MNVYTIYFIPQKPVCGRGVNDQARGGETKLFCYPFLITPRSHTADGEVVPTVTSTPSMLNDTLPFSCECSLEEYNITNNIGGTIIMGTITMGYVLITGDDTNKGRLSNSL